MTEPLNNFATHTNFVLPASQTRTQSQPGKDPFKKDPLKKDPLKQSSQQKLTVEKIRPALAPVSRHQDTYAPISIAHAQPKQELGALINEFVDLHSKARRIEKQLSPAKALRAIDLPILNGLSNPLAQEKIQTQPEDIDAATTLLCLKKRKTI